jgi:hypothetical protein
MTSRNTANKTPHDKIIVRTVSRAFDKDQVREEKVKEKAIKRAVKVKKRERTRTTIKSYMFVSIRLRKKNALTIFLGNETVAVLLFEGN